MKKLQSRFDELGEQYGSLIAELDNNEYIFAFTAGDFFSLQPFNNELSGMGSSDLEFFDSLDKVPGERVFQCAIKDGKIVFCREWCGEENYYDSFFQYQGNMSRRLHYYINGENIDVKGIEELVVAEDNYSREFKRWGYFGNERIVYNRSEKGLLGVSTIFDQNLEELSSSNFEFEINGSFNLHRAYSVNGNGRVLIYDKSITYISLKKLLDKAAVQLASEILESCSHDIMRGKKIECMLLEYSMQQPLPPTIAFVQEREIQAAKDDMPLSWLNAPDLELFSENNQPPLPCENTSIYSTINSHIDKMIISELLDSNGKCSGEENDTTEPEKIVFGFYVKLCKLLRLKLYQVDSLSLSKNFFVVARDYEQCNELDYLEYVLPKKNFDVFQQQIDVYENDQEVKRNANPDYIENNLVLSDAENKLTSLLEKTDNNIEYYYSKKCYYSIRPFANELIHSLSEHEAMSMLSKERPKEWSEYFVYTFKNSRVLCISHYVAEKEIRKYLFTYSCDRDEMYEVHVASGLPIIENVGVLLRKNGLIISFMEYGDILYRNFYKNNSEGRITSYEMSVVFPYYPDSNQDRRTQKYEVNYLGENDIVARIISCNDIKEEHVVYENRITPK